jgi:hypothetical protein
MNGIGILLQKSQINGIVWKTCHYRKIKKVESDTTHGLFSAYTFLGNPLECGHTRILNFIKVLNTLGDIDEEIWAGSFGSEAPDLPCVGDIPSELVCENTCANFSIVTRVDLAGLDSNREFLFDRHGSDVQTIVLVLRFRQRSNRRFGLDSLTITDDRIRLLERDTSVILFKILYYN